MAADCLQNLSTYCKSVGNKGIQSPPPSTPVVVYYNIAGAFNIGKGGGV